MNGPRTFFLLVCLVGLCSCSTDSEIEQVTEDYANRLANILDAQFETQPESVTLAFPALADLKIDIASTNIKMREFYAIQDCPVSTLIAQRNTALGKTQLPSSRYVYEVALIEQLSACLQNTSDEQQKEKIEAWLAIKQQQLPMVWANLIQTSSEIKQFLSSNQGFISGTSDDHLFDVIEALDYLVKLADAPLANSQNIENHLNTLRRRTLIANNWRTQKYLKNMLSQTTQWLDAQFSALDCQRPKDKQQMTYLANVFSLFFIEKIQPLAGQSNHYHYQYEPLLSDLLQHELIAPSLKVFLGERMQEFTDYKIVMQQHVALWQKQLKECNIILAKPL